MNLYVNGCSFTYGHSPTHDDSIKNHRPNWTWNDHLKNEFAGDFVNEAWIGGSNQRILRRTLEFFAKVNDKSSWTAVIQFTDPFARFEFYEPKNKIYVSMLRDEHVLDDQYYNDPKVDFRRLHEISKRYFAYRSLLYSEDQLLNEYLRIIITLNTYFKKHKINHLFTFMSGQCLPTLLVNNDSTLANKELFNILPLDTFTDTAMSRMIQTEDFENPPVDLHPNKIGHQKIYKYILNELQKRNYL